MALFGRTLARLARGYAAADAQMGRPRVAIATLMVAAAIVFWLRFSLTAGYVAASGDYGHYLASAHWLTGQTPTEFGNEGLLGYTALLGLLISVMPEPTATLVSGPLILAILVPAAFFLATRFMGRLPALACAVLLSMVQNFSEMIGWGGNPNALAITFSLVAWGLVIGLFAPEPRPHPSRGAAMAGAFLGLVGLTHSLTFAVTLATLIPYVLLLWATRLAPLRASLKPIGICAAAAALVALPCAPNYYTLLTHGVRPAAGTSAAVTDILGTQLNYLFGETAFLWVTAAALMAVAAFFLGLRKHPGALYLLCGFAVPFLLATTLLRYNPVRALYFVDPPLVVGLFAGAKLVWEAPQRRWIPPPLPRRSAMFALLLACVLLIPASSLEHQRGADRFYFVLQSDDLAAMDWIRENTVASAVVATNGPPEYGLDGRAGDAYGWWIEGYGRREAIATGLPEDFAFDYQWGAVRDANRIFAGDRVVENGFLRAGMPRSLSQPFQPTVAMGWGAEYRPFLYGSDLTARLNGTAVALSAGVDDLSATNSTDGETAYLNASAAFDGSSFGTGSVATTLALREGRADYTVRLEDGSAANLSFVKRVYISSDASLLDVAYLGSGTHKMSFKVAPNVLATPELISVTFAGGEPGTRVEIAWGGDRQGTFVDASASSSASAATLRVIYEWGNARTQPGRAQGILFSSIEEILARTGVTHLFVETAYELQVSRLDSPKSGFRHVFANARVIVYGRG